MNLIEITEPIKPIILVFGKLCSGKGRFCEQYTKQGYYHVTTSDIVKMVSGAQTRSDLQQTKNFDDQIADQMVKVIQQHPKIVIDGIRQVSILRRLEQEFKGNIQKIWLEVPEDIRRNRFNDRDDSKDDKSFDDAQLGDHNLGLTDVEDYIKPHSETIKHY